MTANSRIACEASRTSGHQKEPTGSRPQLAEETGMDPLTLGRGGYQ